MNYTQEQKKLIKALIKNIKATGTIITATESKKKHAMLEHAKQDYLLELNNSLKARRKEMSKIISRENVSEWAAIHTLFTLKKFLCNDGLNRVMLDNYLSALHYTHRYIYNNYYAYEKDCLGTKAITIGDGADVVNEVIIYIINNFMGMDMFGADGTGERTRNGELRSVWYNISCYIRSYIYDQSHTRTRRLQEIDVGNETITLGLNSNILSAYDVEYRVNIFKNLDLTSKQREYALLHFVYGYGIKAIAKQTERDTKTIRESLNSVKKIFINKYAKMLAENGIDVSAL